jgi:putative PIG3 family NAD(P)H quinone oxidoreductase
MRAVCITRPGDPDVLQIEERPEPDPTSHEVLIRVSAAGVNRADLMQRRGAYPAPAGAPADIPGLEYAGTIERIGAAVTGRNVGDRVMGLIGGGAYAEYVVAHEAETIVMPESMSFDEGASIPEAFITAHDALFTQSQLCAGETVLIHAVGSGVGTAAVQLAHACGARVIGTARGTAKLDRAKDLGMSIGIDASSGAFADAVSHMVGADGVDVVLELVGGDYVAEDLRVMAKRGRIALVGLMAGRTVSLDLGTLLRKRITLRGTVMRARALDEKIAAARAFASFAMPLFVSGELRAVTDRVFEMENAAAAHAYVESNASFGKVLLRM